ncbi:conserved hypothetical protein [Candidatus Sulfotelmatobacter kueseliae]|uniref:Uncharacterized protein n=1 Tax=Candidatus Sulfotelmatobacter kueseliae TaxID=2042962 RepID=A0A2U3KJ08_9BACT|nr:conserved hypothetical protein [Candidatus Sulfotelmatobacter kueseliae]
MVIPWPVESKAGRVAPAPPVCIRKSPFLRLLGDTGCVLYHTQRRHALSYNAPVMIAKDLLEILVCPACKQALEYRQNPESLKCSHCHRVYAVKDNIPIMLVDEATIEP